LEGSTGTVDWFDKLPKIELHVHLEGAIPHTALFDLVQKYGGDPSVPDVAALRERFTYRDFPQFIAAWSWKNQFLREYEDFTHIAQLVARDLAGQNIRYAEMFYSPSLFVRRGLEVRQLTRAIRAGVDAVPQIEIALIADLVRDYGPQSELATLMALGQAGQREDLGGRAESEDLGGLAALGVIGIGLGGSEHEFPPEPFESLYRAARRMGLHTTAHAGEAAGPSSVWGALRSLQAERIGHATRAREDPELVDFLAERRVPLELCPGSNVRTGVVRRLSEHPIRTYFDRGCVISVNTDDPRMFGTALADEYRLLVQECGFTREEICRLILLGIESSWLPDDRKAALAAEFTRDPAWVGA
jgi:adenosine deaminase